MGHGLAHVNLGVRECAGRHDGAFRRLVNVEHPNTLGMILANVRDEVVV